MQSPKRRRVSEEILEISKDPGHQGQLNPFALLLPAISDLADVDFCFKVHLNDALFIFIITNNSAGVLGVMTKCSNVLFVAKPIIHFALVEARFYTLSLSLQKNGGALCAR